MSGPDAPVVLDAMGGDHAPGDLVAGAVAAVREHGVQVMLTGQAPLLADLLASHQAAGEVGIRHAPDVIPMGDSGVALRASRRTSAAVACDLVATGQAAALVSAGSTGGMLASAVSRLGTLRGVLRPAIAVLLPTASSRAVLLDAGATPDPTPEMLAQFAILGAAYASVLLSIEMPRVGLLTIGSEPGKGNRLARRAQELIRAAPVNFVGNLESYDALGGAADVVVTDGFTGNVMLKAIEASLRLAAGQTRSALTAGPVGAAAAFANRGRMRRLAERFDADAHGGAVLLGLAGTAVIAHGSARAPAVTRACVLARDLARGGVSEGVERSLAQPAASASS